MTIGSLHRTSRVRRLSALVIAGIIGLAACADFSAEPAEETNQPSLSAAAMHPQDELSFPIPTTPVTQPTDAPQSSASQSAPPDPCAPTDPTIIAACLDTPWGLAVLPDGASALVGERKTGRILLVRPQTEPELVVQIDGIDATGDGGLLGIALSPHFVEDGLVYAYVTTATDNSILRIATGDVPKAIFTGIPKGSKHNGGRITFGADGFLYIATGDAGVTGAGNDQRSLAGKVLRIDEFGNPVSSDRVGGTEQSTSAPALPTGSTTPPAVPTTSAVPSAMPTTEAAPAPSTGTATNGSAEPPADPASAIYASGLVNPTGICQLGAAVGVIDRVGAADVLTQLSPRLDIPTAAPVWSFQQIDGGGIDCASNETTLAASSLDLKLVTALTLNPTGGFSGQPEQLAKDTYGRLLTLEPGAQGLLWATTSNLDGFGDPQPRDDMVVVLPTGSSGGDGGRD